MLLHSRLYPIIQDKIRLDVGKAVWDNSDMQDLPSQSVARANIRRALELRNKSSFDVSVTLGKNRTYLDDYLRDRKQSISGVFAFQLARLLNMQVSYIQGLDDLPDTAEHIIEAEGEVNQIKNLDQRIKDINTLLDEGRRIHNRRGLFGKKVDSGDKLDDLMEIRDDLVQQREWIAEGKTSVGTNPRERFDWVFPDAFMRDQLKINPKEMAVFSVHDTSMTRENGIGFHVGDQIIISKKTLDLRLGGLFLISSNQSLFVRQVELLAENSPLRIRCRAYNSDYPTFDLEIGGEVRVLGKAVAAIKML